MAKPFFSLLEANPVLAAEWHPTKNIGESPSTLKANSAYNAWWIGSCGHEWQAVVYARNRGAGCPFCANQKLLKGFNDLNTVAPEVAAEWHPTNNGDQTPDSVLAYSTKEAVWLGKCGHEWSATIAHRVKGVGCPYCNNKKVLKGYNDFLTTHSVFAAEWHPTKNNFGPDSVTAGSQKKVWWLGKCGHEWNTTIGSRTTQDHGCPYCANKKLLKGFNDFATRFPNISEEWHPTKNLPLEPSQFMMGIEKVWWKCSVCGHEWQALPKNRVRGSGCPICANKRKGNRSKIRNNCVDKVGK